MKRFLAGLLVLCISVSLFGCSTSELDKIECPAENIKLEDNEMLTVAQILTDNLYEDDNILISPLSISMALAIAANGANGETKEEIEAFLGMDIDSFNSLAKQIMDSVKQDETLDIANGIWSKEGKTVLKDLFQDVVLTDYDGELRLAAMNQDTVNEINAWVKEKTRDMIPSIINELNAETMAVIVNAVYFDALWEEPFNDYQVFEDIFVGFDEDKTVTMMTNSVHTYMENENATAFEKEYTDGKYSFIGILPKEEGEFNLSDLDLKGLLETKTDEYTVNMYLPKFEFEFGTDKISDVLKTMGIKTAFSDTADFSNMFEGSEEDGYSIPSIIHKAKIEVTEEGTKAAAATAIMLVGNDMPKNVPEVKIVNLNRPFAFIIMDNENNVPLFIGKVINP